MLFDETEIIEIFTNPIIPKLDKIGLLDSVGFRNFKIMLEYKKLRKDFSAIDSIYMLAEKHHLSIYSINKILFEKRKLKRNFN